MRRFLISIAITLVVAANAVAQQYPIKPVRVIIPFPPAGPTDIFGRMTADILTKTYGQQFVPDNRAGAGGNIGTEQCAKSPPDGYTICIVTVSLSIAPALFPKLAFDPIKDFTHVTLIAKVPSVLTVPPGVCGENSKGHYRNCKSSSWPIDLCVNWKWHQSTNADGIV